MAKEGKIALITGVAQGSCARRVPGPRRVAIIGIDICGMPSRWTTRARPTPTSPVRLVEPGGAKVLARKADVRTSVQ